MNIVDYIVIGVIGVSVLFGLYRGFVSTVLNTGGALVSFGLSFWLYPQLAEVIQGNAELKRTLLTYTDAASRIGDLETSIMNVVQLSADRIAEVVSKANLPPPLDTLLKSNLEQHVFTGVNSVSGYVSDTVLSACINIICFILCFAAVFLALSILVNLLRAVFRFPVLKQLDGLAGGAFGLLRGLLLCYVLFTVTPMILTMVPVDLVSKLIAESTLAPLFTGGNLVLAIMNGKLI